MNLSMLDMIVIGMIPLFVVILWMISVVNGVQKRRDKVIEKALGMDVKNG